MFSTLGMIGIQWLKCVGQIQIHDHSFWSQECLSLYWTVYLILILNPRSQKANYVVHLFQMNFGSKTAPSVIEHHGIGKGT